jgi:hypothetical protein
MTRTQLIRAAAVLSAALVVWGVVELLTRGIGDETKVAELTPGVNAQLVESVTIAPAGTGEEAIRIERQGAGWLVNGYAASTEAVDGFLTELAKPLTGELVARSASSHARMGVDSANGRLVSVRQGGATVAALVVSREGRSWETVFARPEQKNEVYLVRGSVASMFGRKLADWRDKRIVAVEPDSIGRVEIERGRSRTVLTRGDSAWSFADGQRADSGAVARLVGEFRALVAQGDAFASPAQGDSIDFSRPERRVTLSARDGRPLAAIVLDSTASGFWVRRDDRETVYWLYSWKANDLTPADSVLQGK